MECRDRCSEPERNAVRTQTVQLHWASTFLIQYGNSRQNRQCHPSHPFPGAADERAKEGMHSGNSLTSSKYSAVLEGTSKFPAIQPYQNALGFSSSCTSFSDKLCCSRNSMCDSMRDLDDMTLFLCLQVARIQRVITNEGNTT